LFIYNPSEESLKRLTRSGSVNRTTVQKNFTMPVKWAGVTSPFGKRFHPVLKRYIQHAGVDMRARYVPLMASKDGTVVFAGYMTGYGKIIKINHGNGFETRSAHLDKMYVKTGDRVKAGQVIGKTGMSGRVTGPHLHFEIRKNGKANNPMNYLVR
ncbi:MAG: M23 family metallopeptidase, partial [Cetobacterium sp.]